MTYRPALMPPSDSSTYGSPNMEKNSIGNKKVGRANAGILSSFSTSQYA